MNLPPTLFLLKKQGPKNLDDRGDTAFIRKQFRRLQQRFSDEYKALFPGKFAAKTVIVVPSLTLDTDILHKIVGCNYYEERMLCHLLLLRMPNTHLVYVTSMPIDPIIIDYYLHLLPGITGYHARQRLTLISCFDASRKPLIEKILARPRLIERIRKSIPAGHPAHLSCFNVTAAERRLAVELDLPIYGCDPDLEYLGNKSNSRKIFRAGGISVPHGYEDLKSEEDVVNALVDLKSRNPQLRKAVVKINEGFSGEGNAIFSYSGAPNLDALKEWIREVLPSRIRMVAENVTYSDFIQKFATLGGITEEFLEGELKATPSVQCRINPLGEIEVISTHDQITGGESGQVFLGASFPAAIEYAGEIGEMGKTISRHLRELGVLGRFSIDFMSIKKQGEWRHFAIEINLRKGGTTHPYLMLQFLTDGRYNEQTGIYQTANGLSRYYTCSDNLQNDAYKGLTPPDLIDIAICHELLYNGTSQEGVMFHLISSLSQFGKLGVVCIASSPERAAFFYNRVRAVLDLEAAQFSCRGTVSDKCRPKT